MKSWADLENDPAANNAGRVDWSENRDANDDFVQFGPESVRAAVAGACDVPSQRKPLFQSGISASALMSMKFDPIRYVVPGYVAEGLTLFAGAPKIGKSWTALDLGVSVACGGSAFGSIKCDQGDVLYLALEDNQRRLQSRLKVMGRNIAPQRLTFMTEWPTLDEGCLDELEAWAQGVEKPRLVIVDVFAKIKPPAKGTDQLYDADYRTMTGLQAFATRHRLAVVVVHHTRKMEAEDPFDTVSGTRGLTGAADTIMVLKRDIGTAKTVLYVRGRDVEEVETALEFKRDIGTWIILGAAHEVGKTNERQAILSILQGKDKPLSAREVSDLLGKNYDAVRKCLTRMVHSGEIEKTSGGYVPVSPVPLSQSPTDGTHGTHGTGDRIRAMSRPTFPAGDDDGLDADGNIIGWDD
ncbi:AAA family ATPase [Sphingobium yanoikuyae]|uniref:AAA family ATPase n=1 Tax=Sphingobium yanoikuyae TaxID=13690 RepID=A0A9X7YCB3_SPHYA|nr:AAA family ATPase [Sphingobium yanoikuyae]QNG45008.1 AAA family ATPase [Sphingobium yanoikuyae]